MSFYSISGLNGIVIIVDNLVKDEPNIQQEECHQEVFESLFKTKLAFLVLCFSNLSYEALHILLTAISRASECFNINIFSLIIRNNEIMPTQDILNYFFNCQLTDKPKMFIFFTKKKQRTGNIDVQDHQLFLPPNSIVLTANSQNILEVSLYMHTHCHNTPLKDVFHAITIQIKDNGYQSYAEYQSNIDPQFILNSPNDSNK